MKQNTLYVLSIYLKKWSYIDNKATFNYAFVINDRYFRKHHELRMTKNIDLAAELLKFFMEDAKQGYDVTGNAPLALCTESEIHSKLELFTKNVCKEFMDNKKSGGKSRMISSRSVDLYYNDKEYEMISDDLRFYVHLNRGLNKANGELWSNAIADFKIAKDLRPTDVEVNKHLATAYTKSGHRGDAIDSLKFYAESENSPESLSMLASTYVNMEQYEKADQIYEQISQQFNDNVAALFGRAKIAYRQCGEYLVYLDKIYEIDPNWLIENLSMNWDYDLGDSDLLTQWNSSVAARYLGFDRPFDVTKRALNKEIPCHFNGELGTVRFVREEIDCWIELHERYHLDICNYTSHPERLLPQEINPKLQRKKKLKTST